MNQNMYYHKPERVNANSIEIVYDTFGKSTDPPMLLVMGLGAQLIAWDEDFCRQLAAHGYYVIRFDNRDVGLSSRLDSLGVPDIPGMMQSMMEPPGDQAYPLEAPYYLWDMAEDAIGLLDALEIERAHVVGVSMGGMIVQEMVIRHPERILSMTSIMSTSNPAVSPPRPEALAILMSPPPANRTAHIENAVEATRVLNGTAFPIDENRVRQRAARAFDRGLSPMGTARQLGAVLASGSRSRSLESVKVPALVIHGDADPLVPVEGGLDTARAIPNAKLLIIEGMGHDLPPQVWSRLTEAVVKHAVD